MKSNDVMMKDSILVLVAYSEHFQLYLNLNGSNDDYISLSLWFDKVLAAYSGLHPTDPTEYRALS